jgi:transcriptional antiterminator NusG
MDFTGQASTELRWYVVRVQTGREDKVRDTLEKQVKAAGLETQIAKVVVPTENVSEIRGGKKSVRKRKVYPGYLMVEMMMNRDTWYLVRGTAGIGDFLGSLGKPVPMQQHEVDRMLHAAAAVEQKPQIKIRFHKGDSVRIKEGPFENFDGVVEEVQPAKGVVKVIVTIFGRATPVELEYWQVESV